MTQTTPSGTQTAAAMTHTTDGEPYLTTEGAAKLLQLTPKTLRNWRSQNKGPPYNVVGSGSKALYLRSDLIRWYQGQRQIPGSRLARLAHGGTALVEWRGRTLKAFDKSGEQVAEWQLHDFVAEVIEHFAPAAEVSRRK